MGYSKITGDEGIYAADNMSFDGTARGGKMITDGQLWIGSTTSPHVRLGALATDGTIGIATGNGTITLSVVNPGFYLIDGDTGSASPSSGTLNLISGNSTLNAGSSVLFSASGSTVTLNVTDSNSNTILGKSAGNLTLSGTANSGYGQFSLSSLTSGINNAAFSYGSLNALTSGGANCAFGHLNLNNLLTGSFNVCIGDSAGSLYTTSESSNILLNNTGTVSESNALRIGAGTGTGNQQLNKAFISGINGVTSSNETAVTINSSTDQLGVRTLTSTPTASAVSKWDANVNMSANSFIEGYRTTATGATTTTLVVGDAEQQYFTGSTTQTVVMPVTSTLVLGQSYTIINNSSGVVTVQSSGANTIQAMAASTVMTLTVIDTSVTTAAGWNKVYASNTISSGGISTLSGDSGSATGSTVTIAGSEGTATFTGSGSTMTLSFTKATQNTAIGFAAGNSGGGTYNSAFGYNALSQASSGANYNCAFGRDAGINTSSTAGSSYFGYFAGYDSIGNNCTGVGFTALGSGSGAMLGDFNLAVGSGAGTAYATGNSGNIAIAAAGVSGDVNITRIGYVNTSGTTSSQLGCYIDGINGVVAGSTAVLVATTGQLGVAASSERFKLNIVDMVDTSDVVSKLRPVNFNWNKKSAPGLADASDDVQYGLISEEVDKVFPYLCSYDKDGKPFSVKYDQLPAILLNELQKAIKRIAVLEAKLGV